MAEKFGHEYELFVGKPTQLIERHHAPTGFEGTTNANIKSPENVSEFSVGGYIDYLTIPKGVKKIVNPIQLEAEIKYTVGKTSGAPQTATIRVYNLSEDTLNFIEADAAVVLKAGYTQDAQLPLIFVGQVEKVFTNRVGPDNITTIIAKDGSNVLKNVKFVAAYPSGQTYGFVIGQMIKAFADNGVPLGGFERSFTRTTQPIKEAQAYSGMLGQELSSLCEDIDYIWYLSKGKLYIQPKEVDRLIDVINISAKQVVGTLKPNDDKTGKSSKDKESKPSGVKLTTFLNGDIGTHTYLNITYGDYKGQYKPDSVSYKLNWKNGPWTTTIESQRVKKYVTNNTI
jgi:hypothetical protein